MTKLGLSITVVALFTATASLTGCNTKPINTSNVATNHANQVKQSRDLESAVAYLKGKKQGSPSGDASLTVDTKSKVLTVALVLTHLSAGQKYSLIITNKGGKRLYQLKDVTADKTGGATSLTTLKGVDGISRDWEISVLAGSSSTVLSSGHVEHTK